MSHFRDGPLPQGSTACRSSAKHPEAAGCADHPPCPQWLTAALVRSVEINNGTLRDHLVLQPGPKEVACWDRIGTIVGAAILSEGTSSFSLERGGSVAKSRRR